MIKKMFSSIIKARLKANEHDKNAAKTPEAWNFFLGREDVLRDFKIIVVTKRMIYIAWGLILGIILGKL